MDLSGREKKGISGRDFCSLWWNTAAEGDQRTDLYGCQSDESSGQRPYGICQRFRIQDHPWDHGKSGKEKKTGTGDQESTGSAAGYREAGRKVVLWNAGSPGVRWKTERKSPGVKSIFRYDSDLPVRRQERSSGWRRNQQMAPVRAGWKNQCQFKTDTAVCQRAGGHLWYSV